MVSGPTTTADANQGLVVAQSFVEAIPYDFARTFGFVGIGVDRCDSLVHAESTPAAVLHNTAACLGIEPSCVLGDAGEILASVEAAYSAKRRDTVDDMVPGAVEDNQLSSLWDGGDNDLLSMGGKAPTVALTDALLFHAIDQGASDVHIQQASDAGVVRYRVDGVLLDAKRISAEVARSVVSRIKVIGGMDVAEQRLPQDGRATVQVGSGRTVDLRISTIPTCYGERAVLRLLDATAAADLVGLADLGMPQGTSERFLGCVSDPHGMVLLTGPTGSGKTTTLYATLRWCADRGRLGQNIMTIEDPIEYRIPGYGTRISQSQVNRKKGITFAAGLRHLLRQDPDVIMVGEIRDAETASLAVQASLTGHLVLSTLHTNDSVSAVPRLFDLGLEPYLVAASLRAVLAQRLLRRVHGACGGRGCEDCLNTGLKGRVGVFELLRIDDTCRQLIADGARSDELASAAHGAGLIGLRERGEQLVQDGVTTREEMARVLLAQAGEMRT